MNWRLRINYSLQANKDPQNELRFKINGLLEECGLINSGTSRWETVSGGASAEQVARRVGEILTFLSETGALDHISIDVDCGVKSRPDHKFDLKL